MHGGMRFLLVLLLIVAALVRPSSCSSRSSYPQAYASSSAGDEAHFTSTVASRCATNFAKVDYSPITSKCKAPSYDKFSCCTSFNTLACKYKSQVNDFGTTCPLEFMAYLNLAGGYQDGIFIGRCNTDNKICAD